MFKINSKIIKQTINLLLGSIGTTLIVIDSVQSASVPSYSIVDLSTLPGYEVSNGTNLNQSGQVVGYSFREQDGHFRAFLWDKGVIKDLGTLGGDESNAQDINNSGKVVGGSYTGKQSNGVLHAYTWTKNTGMIDITPSVEKQQTRAEAINDANQIVISQGNQAFLINNGVKSNLCLDSSTECFAYDINNVGFIVGYSAVVLGQECSSFRGVKICYDVTARRAHLWKNGNLINLGTIGDAKDKDNWSQAVAINEKGEIVGDANNKCVLWEKNGNLVELGISGSRCVTKGINNKGWVVGWVDTNTPDSSSRAFLWRKEKGVQDLNNLIQPNSGWILNSANSINDAGQITGYGKFNGKNRAFLLIPTSAANSPTSPK